MNKDNMAYGVAGLVLGGIITALAVGYVGNNNWGMMDGRQIGQGMPGNLKQGMIAGGIDRHFIEQMIPHHEDAIAMANLALTKAKHQEIKDLSNNIIRSQSAEIAQMRTWYKEWFGKDVAAQGTGMGPKGMGGGRGMMGGADGDMSALETASDFDREFIREMTAHHQSAIMMSNMLLSVTDRPEMKKLAQDIIAAQTNEIEDMQKWSKEWGYSEGK